MLLDGVILLVFSTCCLMSMFYRVSSGEETPNIGNINTVEVLIFNPNGPYLSVHSGRGCVAAAETDIDDGLRTAGSNEHNCCSHISTVQMGLSHDRCCLLILMGGRVVTSCSLHILLSTCGIYVVMRGHQKQITFTGTYVQNRPHTEKPGKSTYPLPAEKKLLRARHSSYSARIELKPRR